MDCKCTFAQRMNGDGCDICNPAKALEICRENYAELEKAARRLVEAVTWMDEVRGISLGVFLDWCAEEEIDESLDFAWKDFESALAEVEAILGEGE